MKYLADNWYWLSGLLVLVMSLINTATKHWSTHAGLVKWLLFASEMLSVLKSAGEPAGKLGNIKSPGTVIGSNNIFPTVLALIFVAQGCSANPMGAVDKSVKAVQLAGQIVMPVIHAKCMAEARKCALAKDKICSDWVRCDADRERFRLAVDATQDALSTAASIIERVCANDACAEMRDK